MEDKRLVLNFMGVEPTKFNDTWSWSDSPFFYCQGDSKEYVLDSIANYVKYDTSWDALKPVVDKISEYRLAYPEQANKVCDTKVVIEIKRLCELCVEFIKWYNNENIMK